MNAKDKKRLLFGIISVIFFNFILILTSIISGINKGNLMLRFGEHQTVTLFSGLFLGFTAMTSLFIYFLKRQAGLKSERYAFWMFSAIGFIYLCLDEYFMAHEGIDNWVGSWFGKDVTYLNLDNLVIAFYGLVALYVCYHLRRAVLSHKVMWPCLGLGGFCLAGTVVFHSFEKINIIFEVVGESFKIVGVTFFFLAYFLVLLASLDRLTIIQTRPAE
ncbi:MAG TPA: hypothetical protein DCL35_06910 [Candidatus Omnitrophica bacterium]|nr:hypothetical protein [Candidatus Omnitrophota bacterium]